MPKVSNEQPRQTSASIHDTGLLFSAPIPQTDTPSIHLKSTTDHDRNTKSPVPQSGEVEDEYTLSAYGDISLSEVIVPPLPAPIASHGPLQPGYPQTRLRLKVRRPPMPKRRTSYTYMPDPLPYSGGMDPDVHWPGSPRPFVKNSPWFRHQPLAKPTTPEKQGNRPIKDGGSSFQRLFDELVPRSPSVRPSPPGSPVNQAISLPCSSSAPIPRQDKPKEAPWRTRLPPRLPIPKWDV